VQAPQEAEVMAQQGRNARCPCGSGRKVKRCCGVRRGPSEAELAKAFLHQQARAAGRVSAELAAAVALEQASRSTTLLRASLLAALRVSVGAARTPAGLLVVSHS
jgi:hypothetical protein